MRKALVVVGLLAVAAVMLVSASEVDQHNIIPCCDKVERPYLIKNIKECHEQEKRKHCKYHAFIITTTNGVEYCLDPTLPWLKKKMKEGLKCPPDIEGETSEMKS